MQEQLPFALVAGCSLSRTVTGSFEGSWTIGECGNEKTHNLESRTPLPGKYELRQAVKKLYQLRPELSTPNMTSCVPQLVRNCISCIERYGYTKCPTIGRFLHSFIVLYFIQNYMHTYRIVERHRQHSCYIMLLYNV